MYCHTCLYTRPTHAGYTVFHGTFLPTPLLPATHLTYASYQPGVCTRIQLVELFTRFPGCIPADRRRRLCAHSPPTHTRRGSLKWGGGDSRSRMQSTVTTGSTSPHLVSLSPHLVTRCVESQPSSLIEACRLWRVKNTNSVTILCLHCPYSDLLVYNVVCARACVCATYTPVIACYLFCTSFVIDPSTLPASSL